MWTSSPPRVPVLTSFFSASFLSGTAGPGIFGSGFLGASLASAFLGSGSLASGFLTSGFLGASLLSLSWADPRTAISETTRSAAPQEVKRHIGFLLLTINENEFPTVVYPAPDSPTNENSLLLHGSELRCH